VDGVADEQQCRTRIQLNYVHSIFHGIVSETEMTFLKEKHRTRMGLEPVRPVVRVLDCIEMLNVKISLIVSNVLL